MAVAVAPISTHIHHEGVGADPASVDPLGFLAGRRFTCYCGRSVVGSLLCGDCAESMAAYFASAARRRRLMERWMALSPVGNER